MQEIYLSRTDSELTHHGIIGQRWGVRRFQNEDGSLTEAGKRRNSDGRISEKINSAISSGGIGSAALKTAGNISDVLNSPAIKALKAGKTGYTAAKTAMKLAKYVGIDTKAALPFAVRVGTKVAAGVNAAIGSYGPVAVAGLTGVGIVATGAAVVAAVQGGKAIAERVKNRK